MKCQILFSGKNKKNNIILSSAENAQRVVKVKAPVTAAADDIYVLYVFRENKIYGSYERLPSSRFI